MHMFSLICDQQKPGKQMFLSPVGKQKARAGFCPQGEIYVVNYFTQMELLQRYVVSYFTQMELLQIYVVSYFTRMKILQIYVISCSTQI